MTMFCFQCEQTAQDSATQGKGCTKQGVCGKRDTTATLQDGIVMATKKIGFYSNELRRQGKKDIDADHAVLELLFATVTNVNFDDDRLFGLLQSAIQTAGRLKTASGAELPEEATSCNVCPTNTTSKENMMEWAKLLQMPNREAILGEDILSLQELLTYGLKGTAAYAHHALVLGKEDDSIYAYFAKALSALALNEVEGGVDGWVALILECGNINLKAMEILDAGNTEHFGHPVPTAVRIVSAHSAPVAGKAILVSGHDLLDLEELLQQTEGKGINVYTHGEMLPAHGYPGLKKYKHLVGNYGGAWQDQRKEFPDFPGPILMTTNCIQNPAGYENRMFTTACVAWPGCTHIADRQAGGQKDFGPVIEAALAAPGFEETGEDKTILVGFGHHAVLSVADKVIEAVKAGKIKRFFLVGGCDGAKSGRNYYTELAEKIPADCVILTLACGKYRFNKLPLGNVGGDIDGIPRLLDVGQCNDAYSAIQIAVALAEAFNTDVNSLPLSIILSWYEQKAVCVLLTLLALGIKNIKLGPSLPAFVSPAVLDVLVKNFNIAPISTAETDIEAALG